MESQKNTVAAVLCGKDPRLLTSIQFEQPLDDKLDNCLCRISTQSRVLDPVKTRLAGYEVVSWRGRDGFARIARLDCMNRKCSMP